MWVISGLDGIQGLQNPNESVQVSRVSETMESSRRWSGFVCPDCRFVFRVPRDHDGRGIVCPSCRRMLKIPAPGDQTPPLIAEARSPRREMKGDDQASDELKVKRRKRKHAVKNPDWEAQASVSVGEARRDRRSARWWLTGGSLCLATVLVLVVTLMSREDAGRKPGTDPAVMDPVVGASESEDPATGVPGMVPLRSDAVFLSDAEPLAERFMKATTVEELLSLVRNPSVVEPKLRKFYPDGKLKPYAYHKFNTGYEVVTEGDIRTVAVANRDFERKQLSFQELESDLLIDWESWVGWSEMSWEDFMSERPGVAKLFRVTLSEVEYYNFFFLDDKKWRSFRLISPDGKHSIYGYVERDSVLASQLRLSPDVKKSLVVLKLKFPENPTSSNQVIIESLVAEGWVLPNESNP